MKISFIKILLCFSVLSSAGADTFYVAISNTTPASPYKSWATAATNIQDALGWADNNDLVLVSNGIYKLSSPIMVLRDVAIRGVNGPDVTIIDGGGGYRCFNLGSYSCSIYNFTITNGYASDYGGGIYCSSLAPKIVNCIFENNNAPEGAGIYYGTVSYSTFRRNISGDHGGGAYESKATECTFSGNSAAVSGGGMYHGSASNCTFTGNSAGSGGGMFGGTADNCTFENNSSSGSGGGINGGTANCSVFKGNSATYDGGGANYATVNSSVFINNSARNGGGVYVCTVGNCSFAGNTAGQSGGGIYNGHANNCIVWYNSATNNGFDIYSCVVSNVCSPDVIAGINGCITNKPLFANYSAGDLHLLPTSPCINAGNNDIITGTKDLDGNGRILGGIVDIGAYEYNSTGGTDVAVHYVSTNSTHSMSPYDSWVTAATNINMAVNAAENGNKIFVTNGVYKLTNSITVQKNILIKSVNGPDVTIVDGMGLCRCFNLGSSSCTISGFTITNGTDQSIAGGIYCTDTSPLITNCIIADNHSTICGGMYKGTVVASDFIRNTAAQKAGAANETDIKNCRFIGNYAHGGGGGATYNCTVDNTDFISNSASGNGGGMFWGSANHCTFIGNSAVDYGGAIYNATANNSYIINNSSKSGGGVYWSTATDCIFSNNQATSQGGGAYGSTVTRCKFLNNIAGGDGGGMNYGSAYNCLFVNNSGYNGGGISAGTANNCTIMGNMATGYAGGGIYQGNSSNCIVWYNTTTNVGTNIYIPDSVYYICSPDVTNGINGCITNHPYLNNSYYLSPHSPCIDAGGNCPVNMHSDLDGNILPVDGNYDRIATIDIGCYEYNPETTDYDGDGMFDADEVIAGTQPDNRCDVFDVENFSTTNGFLSIGSR